MINSRRNQIIRLPRYEDATREMKRVCVELAKFDGQSITFAKLVKDPFITKESKRYIKTLY